MSQTLEAEVISTSRKGKQGKKSTNELMSMARQLSARHQKFCSYVSQGMPYGRAYQMSGYITKDNANADTCGWRLMQKPEIIKYVNKLKEVIWQGEAATFHEKRAILAKVMRAKGPKDVEGTEIHQGYDKNGNATMPNKLAAIQIDNAMAGDNFADQVTNNTNPFGFLVAVFQGVKPETTDNLLSS